MTNYSMKSASDAEVKILTRDLPGNSKTEKAEKKEPKELESMVSAPAIQRKQSFSSKIHEMFVGESAQSVGAYLVQDVVIPAIKDLLLNAVNQGLQRTFYGDSAPVGRRRGGREDYNGVSRTRYRREDDQPSMSRRDREMHNFGEIIVQDRFEGQDILDELRSLIRDYDVATVKQFYQLVGVVGSYTDDRWGWFDLSHARVVRDRRGYRFELPRPVAID